MKDILLVTGNPHKLEEWQRMMPSEVNLSSVDIDLDEIQSDDPEKIIADKARRAYGVVEKPVIVEDISAGLESLQGLPGPFVKFFLSRLGSDALWRLAGEREQPATVSCVAAYYDGQDLLMARGDVQGTVVAPRGDAYGFSSTFVPNGQTHTYAEMSAELKDSLSHRSLAIAGLLGKLSHLDFLGKLSR